MGKMLLGFAAGIAAITLAGTAGAQVTDGQFVGIPNANATVGFSGQAAPGFAGGGVHLGVGHPGFGKFSRGSGGSGGVWVNGGEWARYNNPAFQSDSYNDWWHDRPDRAYPAWMRNNQNCARQWYAGNMLRC